MSFSITKIEYYLPDGLVTNSDLGCENPGWNMALLEKRIGVKQRYIARDGQTALDLAVEACKKLLADNPTLKDDIDGIIFCTQSGDHVLPPNSCILHKLLGLGEAVFAFDYNLACSGYIYGLMLAQGLLCSKQAENIILVNADTYSKYINKDDRSVRMLFGDGASVSWLASVNEGFRVIDINCATAGAHYDRFIIPAGGCRLPKSTETSRPVKDDSGNGRTLENIHMDGMGILSFVNTAVPKQINDLLRRNGLTVSDIDFFVFHQASKVALDSLQRILAVPSDKICSNLDRIGNVVSASIPIALKDELSRARFFGGAKIVLAGFGVGLSWGTALVEVVS